MITTLAMLVALVASPCSDPWDVASMPPELWASYWPKPAPMQEAKPIPTFNDWQNQYTGRLTIDEFVRQNQLSVLTDNLVSAADAYQVIGSQDGKRVVLSALLCQAFQKLENKHLNRIEKSQWKAQQDRAKLQLDVFEMQPLTCGFPPVAQLLGCLGLPPRLECMTNRELSAQMRAARQLAP